MKMRLDKDWVGDVLTIKFLNVDAEGKVIGEAAEALTFDQSKADPAMRAHAERHGWEQRLGDAAAMPKDTKSGKSATVEEKRLAIEQRTKYYEGGATSWNLKGVAKQPLTAEQKRALLDKLAAELGVTVTEAELTPPVTE